MFPPLDRIVPGNDSEIDLAGSLATGAGHYPRWWFHIRRNAALRFLRDVGVEFLQDLRSAVSSP
jgi:hypothetical protein